MKVLILSHHHPAIVAGGAERAAYSLFNALKKDPRIEDTAFLATTPPEFIGHSAQFGSFRSRPDELVLSLPPINGFTLESRDLNELQKRIKTIIHHLQPDIVHLHHVLNWGIEVLELFANSGVRIVLTLHEFILICHQNGQMITTSGELCHEASPVECGRCFPGVAPGKFFVRAAILRQLLRHVDVLISPSQFLADRFNRWNDSGQEVMVIENILGRTGVSGSEQRDNGKSNERNRRSKTVFAYFGQINPFKGVDVLVEAYQLLPEETRDKIDIRIYGENKHWLGGDFDRRLTNLFEAVDGGVHRFGAYRNVDVISLMQQCDWLVVPSIWWENSPVVIQEARLAGCRIICSDIGGMAEKAEAGFDLRFPAGNALALAKLIESVTDQDSTEESAMFRLDRAAKVHAECDEALEAHIAMYQSLVSSSPVESWNPIQRRVPLQ